MEGQDKHLDRAGHMQVFMTISLKNIGLSLQGSVYSTPVVFMRFKVNLIRSS